jgi:nicotinate-nucleotide adenylyltransferase
MAIYFREEMDDIIDRIAEKGIARVALMGGTFDPIHYGHLIAAETVRSVLNFDCIIFLPSRTPPHKLQINVSDAEHRYAMVQMATITNPYFEVSRLELNREGSTYTVDTIRELRSKLGYDIDIFFITGSDAVFEILTWKNPEELLSMCSFVAVTRPGYDKRELDSRIEVLKKQYNSDIIVIEVPSYAISSSDIRQKTACGQSIKYMVSEDVENYIKKNNLYRLQGDSYGR